MNKAIEKYIEENTVVVGDLDEGDIFKFESEDDNDKYVKQQTHVWYLRGDEDYTKNHSMPCDEVKDYIIIPLTGKHIKRNKTVCIKDVPDNTIVFLPYDFQIKLKKDISGEVHLLDVIHPVKTSFTRCFENGDIYDLNNLAVPLPLDISVSIKKNDEGPKIGRLNYLRRNKQA